MSSLLSHEDSNSFAITKASQQSNQIRQLQVIAKKFDCIFISYLRIDIKCNLINKDSILFV